MVGALDGPLVGVFDGISLMVGAFDGPDVGVFVETSL